MPRRAKIHKRLTDDLWPWKSLPGEDTHRKQFDPAGPANLIGKMADLLEAASTELLRFLQPERAGRLAAANWRAMKPGAIRRGSTSAPRCARCGRDGQR